TFTPDSPAICEAMSHLPGTGFSSKTSIRLRYTGFAKIFLGKYVGRDLAPLFGYFHIIHFKHHFPAGIPDNTGTVIIFKLVKDVHIVVCKATTKLQSRLAGTLFSGSHN